MMGRLTKAQRAWRLWLAHVALVAATLYAALEWPTYVSIPAVLLGVVCEKLAAHRRALAREQGE
jgi:hypothetical protein